MDINDAMGRYKKVDIVTASPEKLVVMLYDGAITFLENALKAIDEKHGEEKVHNNIVKAQDIVFELSSSLNFDAGEIADKLSAIYAYMGKKLSEANISKEKKPIIEVIDHLKELRSAWSTISNKTSDNNAKKDDSKPRSSGGGGINFVG